LKDHSSIPNLFVPSLPLHGEKSKVREIAEVSVSEPWFSKEMEGNMQNRK
jgi:hypothetical protein